MSRGEWREAGGKGIGSDWAEDWMDDDRTNDIAARAGTALSAERIIEDNRNI